ncbi:MAG: hypothetical protein NTY67_00040 [Cyanobacteria bacterium]|nr:hypothetical protein [Cyanobacteriota bacterium]
MLRCCVTAPERVRFTFAFKDITPTFTHELLRPLTKKSWLYGFTTFFPLWNAFVLVSIAGIAMLLVSRKRLLALLILVAVSFVLGPKPADYTYLCFVPPLALLLVIGCNHQAFRAGPKAIGRWPILAGVTSCSLLFLSGYTRIMYQAWWNASEGLTLTLASDLLARDIDAASLKRPVLIGYPGVGAYSPSLVALGQWNERQLLDIGWPDLRLHHNPHLLQKYEALTNKRIDHYLLPQLYDNNGNPPPREVYFGTQKFRLLVNRWQVDRPRLLGFTRIPDKFAQGYSYALYGRL